MTNLDDLVAPGGVTEFLDTTWGHRLGRYTGEDGRFAHLMPWTAFNELLRRHRLEEPRLRLARDGAGVRQEEYTTLVTPRRGAPYHRIDQGALAERIRDGATLVIDSIDELYGPVDELAADLEAVLRERVQVNCYFSLRPTHGFVTHWDDHDVLAVQVHGRKHWRVFGPTRPHPTRRDVEVPTQPTGPPAHDFELTAGDVLHIPRGWWHDANALDGPSLHLTFGVNRATGTDLLGWVSDELRRHELARADLPRFADAETQRQHVKELAELTAAIFAQPDALQRFLADRDATAVPRAWGALPFSVHDPLPAHGQFWVRLNAPRAVLDESGGVVELSADGKRYTFAAAAAPILRVLVTGRSTALAELAAAAPALPESTVRGLCSELLRLGAATAGVLGPG
ncbi:MAG: cupin domain-containing protein [Sciscionella sp.]